jgi:hypothetical protein
MFLRRKNWATPDLTRLLDVAKIDCNGGAKIIVRSDINSTSAIKLDGYFFLLELPGCPLLQRIREDMPKNVQADGTIFLGSIATERQYATIHIRPIISLCKQYGITLPAEATLDTIFSAKTERLEKLHEGKHF